MTDKEMLNEMIDICRDSIYKRWIWNKREVLRGIRLQIGGSRENFLLACLAAQGRLWRYQKMLDILDILWVIVQDQDKHADLVGILNRVCQGEVIKVK